MWHYVTSFHPCTVQLYNIIQLYAMFTCRLCRLSRATAKAFHLLRWCQVHCTEPKMRKGRGLCGPCGIVWRVLQNLVTIWSHLVTATVQNFEIRRASSILHSNLSTSSGACFLAMRMWPHVIPTPFATLPLHIQRDPEPWRSTKNARMKKNEEEWGRTLECDCNILQSLGSCVRFFGMPSGHTLVH